MMTMSVSRLRHVPGIGVDAIGDAADAAGDPDMLRLENLDTDIRPPRVAVEMTRAAVDDDSANSYLPFQGHRDLLSAAAGHVGRLARRRYDPDTETVSVAGGLNGVLNTLLATVEPGQEVVVADPVYAGLVNRIRLAGGVPRHVPAVATSAGWVTDPDDLAAAVGPNTAVVLVMTPVMPTGALLGTEHWDALAVRSRPTTAGSCTTPRWSASGSTAGPSTIPRRTPGSPSGRSLWGRRRRNCVSSGGEWAG
jgi:aspartate/methionine/tyrosine aminotransferase